MRHITMSQFLDLAPSARRAAVLKFPRHLRQRALANLGTCETTPALLRTERADYVLTLLPPVATASSPAARRAAAVARRRRYEECNPPLGRGGSQRPIAAHTERMADAREMRRVWADGPRYIAVTNEYASAVIASPDASAHRFETLARRLGKPVGWGWELWAARRKCERANGPSR
jgi:hypothetical protein